MKEYKLKPNLTIGENGFVFDPATGDSFLVNNQGQEIIRMLQKNMSERDIKQYFLENYEVDELTFDRSYLDFVMLLKRHNLLTEENE